MSRRERIHALALKFAEEVADIVTGEDSAEPESGVDLTDKAKAKRKPRPKVVVTELDRAKARKALRRLGLL